MNKTKIIIKREFNNRVKKKAFVIMSILGPLLFSAMFIVPAYIQNSVKEVWNVVVVDKTGLTESHLKGNFEFQNSSAVQFNLDHLKEDYEILNSAVGSYSPSIYFKKVEYFLNEGYKFDKAIILI